MIYSVILRVCMYRPNIVYKYIHTYGILISNGYRVAAALLVKVHVCGETIFSKGLVTRLQQPPPLRRGQKGCYSVHNTIYNIIIKRQILCVFVYSVATIHNNVII